MDIEDLAGKTVKAVYRPMSLELPTSEENSYVIVFTDGTRLGFEPDGYSSHCTRHWVDEKSASEQASTRKPG